MDLYPTEEQTHLSKMAHGALRELLPVSGLRDAPSDVARAAWPHLASLGLIGVMAPETGGGVGLSVVEASLISHELGRTLGPVSVIWSIVAADIAARGGALDICARLAEGQAWAALSLKIRGEPALLGLAGAQLALHLSPDQSLLQAPAANETQTRLACVDATSDLFLMRGEAGPVVRSTGPSGWVLAGLLIAAAMSGISRQVLDMAIEHARTRQQFGKPIGAFQAVRHTCSEMARRTEASRAMANYAAVRLSSEHPESADCVSAARIVASEAARQNCADALQLHGALGMTSEHDLHLYLKRALLLDTVLGHVDDEMLYLATGGR